MIIYKFYIYNIQGFLIHSHHMYIWKNMLHCYFISLMKLKKNTLQYFKPKIITQSQK